MGGGFGNQPTGTHTDTKPLQRRRSVFTAPLDTDVDGSCFDVSWEPLNDSRGQKMRWRWRRAVAYCLAPVSLQRQRRARAALRNRVCRDGDRCLFVFCRAFVWWRWPWIRSKRPPALAAVARAATSTVTLTNPPTSLKIFKAKVSESVRFLSVTLSDGTFRCRACWSIVPVHHRYQSQGKYVNVSTRSSNSRRPPRLPLSDNVRRLASTVLLLLLVVLLLLLLLLRLLQLLPAMLSGCVTGLRRLMTNLDNPPSRPPPSPSISAPCVSPQFSSIFVCFLKNKRQGGAIIGLFIRMTRARRWRMVFFSSLMNSLYRHQRSHVGTVE